MRVPIGTSEPCQGEYRKHERAVTGESTELHERAGVPESTDTKERALSKDSNKLLERAAGEREYRSSERAMKVESTEAHERFMNKYQLWWIAVGLTIGIFVVIIALW